jgi:hypothetical protein
MTPSSALRRLPRSLGRLAQPLRAEGYANVRALHSASRAAAASDDAALGSRAALVASAFAATTLLSATALAEQAAVAATLPNDPADALKSLKSLADAKEIVLYQYEVCPFCNKARTATVVPCDVCPVVARQAPTNTATACFSVPAARFPRLPPDPLQGGGGKSSYKEGAEVERVHQGARPQKYS